MEHTAHVISRVPLHDLRVPDEALHPPHHAPQFPVHMGAQAMTSMDPLLLLSLLKCRAVGSTLQLHY